jgi:hypothetical protein
VYKLKPGKEAYNTLKLLVKINVSKLPTIKERPLRDKEVYKMLG